MAEILIDNTARSRFELDDGQKGFVDYRRSGKVLFLNHVEVPALLAGRGQGTRLVRAALDLIRSRGERMVPVCPFIKALVRRYPHYSDLISE